MFSSWETFLCYYQGHGDTSEFRSLLVLGQKSGPQGWLESGLQVHTEVCFWLFLTPQSSFPGVSRWTGHGHWLSSPKPWELLAELGISAAQSGSPMTPNCEQVCDTIAAFPNFLLWIVSLHSCVTYLFLFRSLENLLSSFSVWSIRPNYPVILPRCGSSAKLLLYLWFPQKNLKWILALLGHSNASSSLFTPFFLR